ncbi:site-specific integrase [Lentisphaerota bacterium WC36G]|nr:site-specific integrase [Lentisphaerae bacterium WC36]
MSGMLPYSDKNIIRISEYFENIYNGSMWNCLFITGCSTGARISELINLKRSDVLDKNCQIKNSVKLPKLKTRKENDFRIIPLSKKNKQALFIHLQVMEKNGFAFDEDFLFTVKNDVVCYDQIYRKFRATYQKLQIATAHGTHGMRKTFAKKIYLYYRALNPHDPLQPLIQTQRALGHAKLETTLNYLDFLLNDLSEAVCSFDEIFCF